MKTRTVNRELMCELTTNELLEKSEELATALGRVDDLEAEKKKVNDTVNYAVKQEKATASYLADIVRQGEMLRPVKCSVRESEAGNGTVVVARLDTEEIVETRPMNDMERQEDLEFGKKDQEDATEILDEPDDDTTGEPVQ